MKKETIESIVLNSGIIMVSKGKADYFFQHNPVVIRINNGRKKLTYSCRCYVNLFIWIFYVLTPNQPLMTFPSRKEKRATPRLMPAISKKRCLKL